MQCIYEHLPSIKDVLSCYDTSVYYRNVLHLARNGRGHPYYTSWDVTTGTQALIKKKCDWASRSLPTRAQKNSFFSAKPTLLLHNSVLIPTFVFM